MNEGSTLRMKSCRVHWVSTSWSWSKLLLKTHLTRYAGLVTGDNFDQLHFYQNSIQDKLSHKRVMQCFLCPAGWESVDGSTVLGKLDCMDMAVHWREQLSISYMAITCLCELLASLDFSMPVSIVHMYIPLIARYRDNCQNTTRLSVPVFQVLMIFTRWDQQ